MRKISRILMAMVTLIVVFAVQVSAYKPVYDGLGDVRWYLGYDPAKGYITASDTAKGVKLNFKKVPDMWSLRVACGYSNNLKSADPLNVGYKADEEGIYVHLEDIKWEVPKPTLSNPKPETSIMITIAQGEGGWSDRRALMFWILRDKDNKYRVEVLRGREASETAGMTPEESTETFHVKFVDFEKPLGNDLHFYMRKTSATEWTVNINDNQFTLKDSESVKERFTDPGAVHVSLGTWNSATDIEYTVSELWSYGCIEYYDKVGGKNVRRDPPEFVEKWGKKPAETPSTSSTPTVKPPATTSSTATSSTVVSSDTSSVISDASSETLNTSSTVEEVTSDPATTSGTASNDMAAGGEEEGGVNVAVIIVIVAIVLVLAGGGIAFYFLFIRKKPENPDNPDNPGNNG